MEHSGFSGDPAFNWRSNNPFLEDVLATLQARVDTVSLEDDDRQSTVSTFLSSPPFERARESNPPPRNFKLPEYWPHAPDLWFSRSELRFEVVGICNERDKFAHVVEALNYDSLKMVKDLLLFPPQFQPYQTLKSRLLLATQLTPIQMAEKLMKAGDLGDRRPSQLLASLLEFCPPGEENTSFFRASFLMRLPADIRGHLDGREDGDLKELAAKADRHWCNRSASFTATVAAAVSVDSDSESAGEPVAAIGSQQQAGGQKKQWKKGGKQSGGQKQKARDFSLKQLTLCWRHQRFGKFANFCDDQANCEFSKSGN